MIVKTTENIRLLVLKKIISCGSESSYTFIYTACGEKIEFAKTIFDYEEILDISRLNRAHKS